MKSQYLEKRGLPEAPGVYFFLGKNKRILYIGKATSLKDRVRSYFSRDLHDARGPLLVQMIDEAESIDFRQTDSVLEALLVEADLIKKFQPRFNTKEKDNKSFNCVVITREDFPQVLIVRKKDLDPPLILNSKFLIQGIFGPFPHGALLKDALKIVRKIFPFRDAKCTSNQGKPCFNRQIGLCPGVCTGEITKAEYKKTIANLKLFLHGKKKFLVTKLKKEMRAFAKKQEFEKATEIKNKIFSLEHIQDVALIKSDYQKTGVEGEKTFRIEAYDVAHISGTSGVGVMVVATNGEVNKSEYKKFKLKHAKMGDDTGALAEILTRRLAHREWGMPNIIAVDGGINQKNTAEKILKEFDLATPVIAIVKDERHKPIDFLGPNDLIQKYKKAFLQLNFEAHRFAIAYHKKTRSKNFLPVD